MIHKAQNKDSAMLDELAASTAALVKAIQDEWFGQLVCANAERNYRAVGVVQCFSTNYETSSNVIGLLLNDLCKVLQEDQSLVLSGYPFQATLSSALQELRDILLKKRVCVMVETVSGVFEKVPLNELKRTTREEAKAMLLTEINRAI